MQVFSRHFYSLMRKFKVFLTTLAFVWLWICGFWAIYRYFGSGAIAWLGLLLNAWALPLWMLLRSIWPEKYRGDQRESAAFAAVLAGLAVVLLTDTDRGQPIYLAICNLFIFLVYLFHLSAVRHPDMPAVDSRFPELVVTSCKIWHAEEYARRNNFCGLLLIFLRGRCCADSRALIAELRELSPHLQKRGVGLVLFSTSPASDWGGSGQLAAEILQLESGACANLPFVVAGGAPLLPCSRTTAAARPSQWLLDSEGVVVWRHLPHNYRTPGSADLLRSQLFRLEE
ncbi:hypothetical protein SAMN05660479_02446 [Microbulbifer thermotolerans]|nr:hypothetical protein SAMN05660479_02446 [Microbulbifer thermotolerans]